MQCPNQQKTSWIKRQWKLPWSQQRNHKASKALEISAARPMARVPSSNPKDSWSLPLWGAPLPCNFCLDPKRLRYTSWFVRVAPRVEVDYCNNFIYAIGHVAECVTGLHSPNSVATLCGSYGKWKASGVNRWRALTRSAFLATLPAKSSLRDREFAFRLRETVAPTRSLTEVRSRLRAVSIFGNREMCKTWGFWEVCKIVVRVARNWRWWKIDKNRHFWWLAQYLVLLKSVLESSKCSFCETVVEFGSAMLTSFRVAVTRLRMPRTHFFVAGAVLASQNIEKLHFVL